MTLMDYMEMKLLHKRWRILDDEWDIVRERWQIDLPEAEFTLKEVEDISSLIDTLGVIRRMYANR
jgi:hypothetical protein